MDNRWFIDPFVERVLAHTPGHSAAELTDIARAIERLHREDLDEMGKVHLELCSFVLAGYKMLRMGMPQAAAVSILTLAVTEPFRSMLVGNVIDTLGTAADGFRALADASKTKEREFFGPSFQFERKVDDESRYHVVVRRCFYRDFCTRYGVPELTPVWCAFDTGWMDAVDPDRFGVRVSRPTTMGYGGDHCDFDFRRAAPTGPVAPAAPR